MIAAAAGAVASVVASSMSAIVGSLVVGMVSGLAGVLTLRAERLIENRDLGEPARQFYFGLFRRLPRVRDIDDPLTIGVHPALSVLTNEGAVDQCPAFVRRDRSGDLEQALRASRFVLVVGESTAGKSRAAYEAMRACLPHHVFVRPPSRQDLRAALQVAGRRRRSVVWLDDLELYLGFDGLVADMLTPLFADPRRHTVVLATMRSYERARYSPRSFSNATDKERHVLRLAGEVLSLAREIRLDRLWSPEERGRAAAAPEDARLVKALGHADRFGVAQYLAAGPQLFQEWQDAWGSWPHGRPRGAALVTAAVDVRRAGHHLPLPIGFLRSLHEAYLTEPGRLDFRLESWEEALAWATEPLYSTSGLLMPSGDDHYVAFDYLPDAADEAASVPGVPPAAWEAIVAFVPPEDVIDVAWAAFLRNRPGVAEYALSKALDAGHYQAALDFSSFMHDSDRDADVVSWLERAIAMAMAQGAPAEKMISLRDETAWWVGARRHLRGDPRRAHDMALAIVQDSVRLFGEDHELTIGSRITLARQVGALGRVREALELAREVAEAAVRVLGERHEMVMSARFEVAVWTRRSGDHRRAFRLWQDLVEAQMVAGPSFVDAIFANMDATLDEIADQAFDAAVIGWLERLADSAALQRSARGTKVRMKLLGTLAWWVGGRADGPGDSRRARQIAWSVVDEGGAALGPDDPDVLRARVILAHQEGMLGDVATASAICRETVDAAARIYGMAHRVTMFAREELARWGRFRLSDSASEEG
ncbi:hypothetical protein [Sphaerisporangium dianthi]|uniref:Tetratricopeptide repeat protein n=1 Tax=Sphaerisporangium dianthi TaxID=1436120 RepID=A0ABV9CLW6_9ACTN